MIPVQLRRGIHRRVGRGRRAPQILASLLVIADHTLCELFHFRVGRLLGGELSEHDLGLPVFELIRDEVAIRRRSARADGRTRVSGFSIRGVVVAAGDDCRCEGDPKHCLNSACHVSSSVCSFSFGVGECNIRTHPG